MVRVEIQFSNGDGLRFASEELQAQAAAKEFVTAFYAQRNLILQQTIDGLTAQLQGQNDRLASGVKDNQLPVTKDSPHA